MIDGRHEPHLHKGADQVVSLDSHTLGKFTYRDRFGYLYDTLNSLWRGNFRLLPFRGTFDLMMFFLALAAFTRFKYPLTFLSDLFPHEKLFPLVRNGSTFFGRTSCIPTRSALRSAFASATLAILGTRRRFSRRRGGRLYIALISRAT